MHIYTVHYAYMFLHAISIILYVLVCIELVLTILMCSYYSAIKDLGRLAGWGLKSKRSLMIVSRESLLDDALHYLTKEGFDPTYPLMVHFLMIVCSLS